MDTLTRVCSMNTKRIAMSTTSAVSSVKQALLLELDQFNQQLKELVLSLPDELEQLDQAEQEIRLGMLHIGRGVLQAWSQRATLARQQPECAACQETMRHKGYVTGPLTTTLGDIRIRRPRFRCEHCGGECYPHDARLRFLKHSLSWSLAKVVGRLGAQLPFDQARQNLLDDYGVRLSKQRIEQVCEEAGQMLLAAEDARREQIYALPPAEQPAALPTSDISAEKVYVSGDGTMIHTEGDWHEIRVASVAATDADDLVLATQLRARFLSCEEFGRHLLLLALGVGYRHAKLRVFLADGAHWLWELAALHFPEAIQILDWYHLTEYVHAAAAALFGEGTEEATAWSDARLAELWEGRWRDTVAHLTVLRKSLRAQGKREALRKFQQYVTNNQTRIDYPRYRELGLRIGSGRVEGACKSLVGARCKQAGMRNWTRTGAQGVLRLRAALQTGDFNSLWDHHLQSAA
jgi:hypothetical protein